MGDTFMHRGPIASWSNSFQLFAKILGVVAVVVVQFVGPPMIFFSRVCGIGVMKELWYKWHCCPWHPEYNPNSLEPCAYHNTLAKDVGYLDDWCHMATTKSLG